jgi:hypothetical protein
MWNGVHQTPLLLKNHIYVTCLNAWKSTWWGTRWTITSMFPLLVKYFQAWLIPKLVTNIVTSICECWGDRPGGGLGGPCLGPPCSPSLRRPPQLIIMTIVHSYGHQHYILLHTLGWAHNPLRCWGDRPGGGLGGLFIRPPCSPSMRRPPQYKKQNWLLSTNMDSSYAWQRWN